MELAEIRRMLRSEAPHVLIEAPAGNGKTHESVSAALDLCWDLEEGQKVLLLAHTNAAVQTFRRRVAGNAGRIEATTLDAFAVEQVAPYAPALGLPVPLRMGSDSGVPFSELAKKLNELHRRSPTIARATADHYPVIILDEHQDASIEQHQMIFGLSGIGNSRLRIFGDPMQAIYGFGESKLIDWEQLTKDVAVTGKLSQPHRWANAADLGDWINESRHELAIGRPLPLAKMPAKRVNIRLINDLPDMPNPNSTQVNRQIIGPLHQLLDRLNGSVVIITRHNAHVRGLHGATSRRLRINEGADYQLAYKIMQLALGSVGSPQAMVRLILDILKVTSTGCTQAFLEKVYRRLSDQSVDLRRSGGLSPFLEKLQRIYEKPTLPTWCEVIELVRREPPEGIKIDLPECLWVLGRLRFEDAIDSLLELDGITRQRRLGLAQHLAAISTIHKVKGQEYDHVILCHCSASPFRDDDTSRKLLYVAISRTRESVTILASQSHPSPLLLRS